MAVRVLTVYSRTYCHLCDDMIAALHNLQGRFVFEIKVGDVDSDAALEARYGELVPLLESEGLELCHYFLDEVAVIDLLRKNFKKNTYNR